MLVIINNDVICLYSLKKEYEMDDFFGQVVEYSQNLVCAVDKSLKYLVILDVFLFHDIELPIHADSI